MTRTGGAEVGRDSFATSSRPISTPIDISQIVTRFPPEHERLPAHRHAKSIALNFASARNLPGAVTCGSTIQSTKEEQEYIDSIQAMCAARLRLGTRFFTHRIISNALRMAEGLIRAGHAYVDDQSQEKSGTSAAH